MSRSSYPSVKKKKKSLKEEGKKNEKKQRTKLLPECIRGLWNLHQLNGESKRLRYAKVHLGRAGERGWKERKKD